MKNKIKINLNKHNMKPKRLCKITGLSQTTIYSIIRGSSNPTLKNAFKISKALNTSVEELFFNDEEKEAK